MDWQPRFRKWVYPEGKSVQIFIHDCKVCGKNAPFGFNCQPFSGLLGDWYCLEHKPKEK